ncbi:MAG: hypothetical protein WC757_04735, partial [Candidatus Paceibacterota bacterium]
FGGNSFGGIQNPLEFLGGNQCRGAKPRGNFFNKFGMVEMPRIEPERGRENMCSPVEEGLGKPWVSQE